ncbi:MAG: acyltransferase [Microbacterium sp. 67-17]|uniref:acyltransferase family protein n=1 Tax=Microbacterium sp. 67-17 TaxID=1895782 RepID=UPI000960A359|nr:acyltransferase family protein [Microbacterium sp. 67-17]OJV98959.1 MAG: acyltransferase [Microbacterium sp. 67-17]
MTPDTPSRTAPRRDIQGLRALAVLAVLGAHAVGWPAGGFVGVDIFFVISGFLITGMLLSEIRRRGSVSVGGFYARRARRILPAALVTLGAVVGAAFALFNTVRADQTLWDAISAALFVSNWRFAAQGTDYFHAADAVSPLQNFWSLSVEEQFYLAWPGLLVILVLLVPVAARRGAAARVVVGIAAGAIVAASFAWALTQTEAHPTLAYFSTLTRAWELAAGALLAAAVPVLTRIPRALGIVMGWLGLAGAVTAVLFIEPTAAGFPAPWAALPVVATCLVLAGGVAGDPRQRHLFPLSNSVSVFVGDMSYSLYLWHFPVIVFAAVLLPESDQRIWIVLGAIAVLSLASYFIVEQPLRYAPWLGARMPAPSDRAASERAALQPAAANGTPASGGVASTRPAGWTPGTRYFPDSRRPMPASALSVPPNTPAVSGGPAAIPPQQLVRGPASPADAESVSAPEAAPGRLWRERFGAQIFLATAGLLAVALGTATWVYSTSGAGPLIQPPAFSAPAPPQPAADPTAQLQAELAAAVAATSWPELHPSLDEVMAQSSGANPAHDCFSPTVTPDPAACTWGSADAPTHLYLVGDSTAMAYAPALRSLADNSGGTISATTVGLYGCRFTDVLVQNDGDGIMAACSERKDVVRQLIAADQPSLVIVSNAFTLGRSTDGTDLSAQDLVAAAQSEAATYGMPGRVVYLAPPPQGVNLGACYSPVSSPSACASAVDDTWIAMWDATVAAAAASGDHAVDALPFSCWEGICPAFAGTLPTKYDQTHLTVPYAEHIAPYLAWVLQSQGLIAAG